MANGIELVIFDCDGVLVDSETLAAQVDVDMLGALGWHLTFDEVVDRFMGRSHEYFLKSIEQYLGAELPSGWNQQWLKRSRDAFDAELTTVDGVVEALDAIDMQTCVASSGSHEKMRRTLGRTGLYDRFDGRIFSATEVENGKPAPDLFLHAAKRMNVAPDACVVVEDSTYGVEAARSAGMHVFAFAGGLTARQRLEGDNTTLFDHMRELPALLRGS